MSLYGCTITQKGWELITKVLASKAYLMLTGVTMGSGTCPDNIFPGDLQGLIEPVTAGTSTQPIYDGDTIHMTVEYRNDLNGGLDHGFWIREFGVFARDLDGEEILLYYATLGDYPQWVSAYSGNGIDIRRFPVSITVGEGATVIVNYPQNAWMTAEDMAQTIAAHNADPNAHGGAVGSAKVVSMALTISTEGWTENRTGKYPFQLDIPVDGATEEMIPNLTILPDGENIAIACGLCPRVQILDGVLRVFAASAPDSSIPASLTLQGGGGSLSGGSGSGSSGVSHLPIATIYQAGAVMPGDGLTVASNGRMSVNTASDAEIEQMLAEVFSSVDK